MASARVRCFVKLLPQNNQFRQLNYVIKPINHLIAGQRQLATSPVSFLQSIPSISTVKPTNSVSYTTYTPTPPSPLSLKAQHSNEVATVENVILPDLMDVSVSQIVDRRNVFRVIYCWLATRWILPKVYRTFSWKGFCAEIGQTLETVSQRLSTQEYAKLHGLVHHETLRDLKKHIDQMTQEQRHQIAVRRVDVVKVIPYWARYVTHFEKGPDAQYIEITALMHVRHPLTTNPKNLAELVESTTKTRGGHKKGTSICLYRFKKDFFRQPGIEPRWTVTLLNHVRAEDIEAKKAIESNKSSSVGKGDA